MIPFVVELGTQTQIMKMELLKFIVRSNSKKNMAICDFGRRLHTQNSLTLDFFHNCLTPYKLEGIIKKIK